MTKRYAPTPLWSQPVSACVLRSQWQLALAVNLKNAISPSLWHLLLFCLALIFSITMGQNTLYWLSIPREDSKHPWSFVFCYQSRQGEHNTVKHWMEWHPTYTEQRPSKTSPKSGCRSPTGDLSKQPMLGNLHMCTPLLPVEGTLAPPHRGQTEQWGCTRAIWHTHFKQRKKTVLIVL